MPMLPPPHFNIKFKAGLLQTWVATRDFKGLDPGTIEWVWIIQPKRYATEKEIKALCAGKPVKIELS